MNARERQLATIRHEAPDRISLDAICVENTPEIAAELGIAQESVYERLGIDGRVVAAGWAGEAPVSDDGTPLNEWRAPGQCDYSAIRKYPLADVTSVSEIERFPWPDPAMYDYAGPARAAEALSAEYAVRGPYWKPVFCQACDMFGMEEAMIRMSVDKPVFDAALEAISSRVYDYCVRMMDACGEHLPIFCIGDDFATQRGLMISPEDWRRFLKPIYARIFESAKARGKHVWFHSCGDVTSVLPDLIDIGMDVWETVQLHALPISAEELKREYGSHITFFGGVNTQRLPFISPDDVRAETIRCIQVLGRNGGYICGPDHHIKPDVSVANTLALFDTAQSFRGAGYTL